MNRPLNRILPRVTGPASVWTWVKWSLLAALLIAVAIIARLVQSEIRNVGCRRTTCPSLTRDVGYTVETGERSHPLPANGPYDQRLGCDDSGVQERLLARGFVVSKQARDSQRMLSLGGADCSSRLKNGRRA